MDGKTSLAYLPFLRTGWIETQSDEQVYYKIKRSTELKKFMGAYAARVGNDVNTLRFLYDGNMLPTLDVNDGPARLDMENDDTIDGMVEQTPASPYH
ncbi:hypothetical protein DXG01_012544 [Tephrocybe rancida]|nr:hypothetical protein DXG01_012544 [Tephrocybe rancida]